MPTRSQQHSDVIIIGAGPAGATAAIRLARAGRQVRLIDGARFPRTKPCAGWVNTQVVDILKRLEIPLDAVLGDTIEELLFCNADISKTTKPQIDGIPGYLVERSDFDKCLVDAAKQAGVRFSDRALATAIQPLEDGVEVSIHKRKPITANLLIVATGIGAQLLRQVGVQTPNNAEPTWSAHVEVPKPKPTKTKPKVIVVLGVTGSADSFCMAVEHAERISLTFNTRGESDARPLFAETAQRLAAGGHLSMDLSELAANSPRNPTFPYSALEMDSHVGKHTLVVGDAGGFFATASHEGIFPAMWSAEIAARVLEKTGPGAFSQDVLMTFDTEWRLEMGDFLRPPNTDLQLLLPLIFSNQPMANRMAAAFFRGENI